MRALATPEFQGKLGAVAAEAKADVARVIAFLEHAVSPQAIKSHKGTPSVVKLTGEIYAAKIRNTHVYFTFTKDDGGSHVLLLDITEVRSVPTEKRFYASNDPRSNSSLNPNINSSINPRYNSSLNPKYNSSINPNYNSSINPKYNSSINPKYNSSINPKYNSSINPNYNSSINPKYNSSINPRYNPSFGGPFLYSLDLKQIGFCVNANEMVTVLFDMRGEYDSFAVTHSSGVIVVFATNGNWIGYWIKTDQGMYLRFDCSGNWEGFVV